MGDQLEHRNKTFISTNLAAELTGYSQDYIGQLARDGHVASTKAGRQRFVDRDAVIAYARENKKGFRVNHLPQEHRPKAGKDVEAKSASEESVTDQPDTESGAAESEEIAFTALPLFKESVEALQAGSDRPSARWRKTRDGLRKTAEKRSRKVASRLPVAVLAVMVAVLTAFSGLQLVDTPTESANLATVADHAIEAEVETADQLAGVRSAGIHESGEGSTRVALEEARYSAGLAAAAVSSFGELVAKPIKNFFIDTLYYGIAGLLEFGDVLVTDSEMYTPPSIVYDTGADEMQNPPAPGSAGSLTYITTTNNSSSFTNNASLVQGMTRLTGMVADLANRIDDRSDGEGVSAAVRAYVADRVDELEDLARANVEANLYDHPNTITLNGIEIEGSADINRLTVTATTSIDGATFFVDASNNRVGIGTLTPQYALDVVGDVRANSFVTSGTSSLASSTVNGDFSVTGNTVLGDDATTDTLTLNSRLLSDIVPATSSVHSIGSSTLRFAEGFFSTLLSVGGLEISTSSIIASGGEISFGDENLYTAGSLSAATTTLATTTISDLTATSAAVVSAAITDLVAANSSTTNATTTNSYIRELLADNSTTTNAYIESLVASSSNLTSAQITNLVATNATATNAFVASLIATDAEFTNASTTNATTTNSYITNLTADDGQVTDLVSTNATFTNATSTNFFSSLANFTTTIIANLTATTANITDLIATNATTTQLVTTDLTATGATDLATTTITDLSASTTDTDTLTATDGNVTNLLVANSTTTNATTTNSFIQELVATNATATNAFVASLIAIDADFTNASTTNATTTNSYIRQLLADNSTTTNAFIENLVASSTNLTSAQIEDLIVTNSSTTNAYIAQLTADDIVATNSTTTNAYIQTLAADVADITNLTGTNATFTNATTTNFFSTLANLTTAVISNLTATVANITNLDAENATSTNLFATNASSTNFFAATANLTNAIVSNLTATIANITNLTAENATTTQLATTDLTATGTTNLATTTISDLSVTGNATGQEADAADEFVTLSQITSGATSTDAFLQDGNRFGALAVLGTNDAQELAFETGGSEAVRIDTAGQVGIGTNNPTQTLSVAGTLGLEGNWVFDTETEGGIERLRLQAAGANDAAELFLQAKGSADSSRITVTPDSSNANYSFLTFESNGVEQIINSGSVGTESTLPFGIQIDGVDVLSINTAGNSTFTGNLTVVGTLDAPTLNTGQGDNELYAMDQNVRTTDNVTFGSIDTASGTIDTLTSTDGTITNLTGTNATFTNATSTNFFSSLANFTTAIISNLTATVANITNLTAENATTTELVTTNLTATGTTNLATTTISELSVTGNATGQEADAASEFVTLSQLTSGANSTDAFLQGGNSFGALAVLGTNDAYDLTFETAGSRRLTIDTDGNIGIGTASPSELFTLRADSFGENDNVFVLLDSNGVLRTQIRAGGSQKWDLRNSTGEIGSIAYSTPDNRPGILLRDPNGDGRSQIVQLSASGGFAFGASAGSSIPSDQVVFTTDGDVGIGTTDPESRLNVVDTTSLTNLTGTTYGLLTLSGGATNNDYTTISFDQGTGNPVAAIGSRRTSVGSFLSFGTSNDYPSGVTNEALVIDPDGNIGIGTTSPNARLDVVGGNIKVGDSAQIGFSDAASYSAYISGNSVGADSVNIFTDSSQVAAFNVATFDLYSNLLYGNSGTSRVGIGTNSPANTLDVNGGIDADTLNTGQGDNELYAMDQNVRTTDNVTFGSIDTASGTIDTLTSTDGTITNLTGTNATFTNATSTNFFSSLANFTTAIISNLTASVATITDLTATNSTTTNATTTNSYIANLSANDADITTANVTDLTAADATSTNLYTQNLTADDGKVTNLTVTNATSTNFFSSLANFTTAIIGNLTATVADITSLTADNATTTDLVTATLTATGTTELATTTINGFADIQGDLNVAGITTAGHLQPAADDTYDLGTTGNRWRDLYLGPSTLYIGETGDQTTISYNTAANSLAFQNTPDSTAGFQFLDSDGGTPILNIDTTNERVGIGTASPSALLSVTGAISGTTLNTGQGDNELYAMNQNVRTTDGVAFANLTVGGDTINDFTGDGLIVVGNALQVDDGPGSGLDADTLDTIDSTQFLRSDASDSFTSGTLSITSGATAFDVDASADFSGNLTVSDNQFIVSSDSGGTGIGQGPAYINPGTAGVNNVLLGLAVNGTEKARIDAEGDIQITGLFNSTQALGTNQLAGSLAVDEDITLGASASSTLTLNARVDGDVIPSSDAVYNLGSEALRFSNIYAATTTIDNLVTGGTASSTFTINLQNNTADAEDSFLAFERGSVTPNPTLGWNSAADRFEFSDFPVGFTNSISVEGTSSSTFAGPVWLEGTSAGTSLSDSMLYINPPSASTDYSLFAIAVNDNERFSVDAEGDTHIHASLGIENALFDLSNTTLTIDDDLRINGNDIKDGSGNTRITLGSTNTITGDLDVTGNAAGQDATDADHYVTLGQLTSGANSTDAFLQGGNSFGALAVLGTNDGNGLAFETGGANRFWITAAGNVGIGTSTPAAKLDVEGDINLAQGYAFTQEGNQVIKIATGTQSYYSNTYVGPNAGGSGTEYQTAVGASAGSGNTGARQTVLGGHAGQNNSGQRQLAAGTNAGHSNVGDDQAAFGYFAGASNTGDGQSVFGFRAGESNIANNQLAVGYRAGYSNSGANQAVFGYEAGQNNTGNNQIALGYEAGEGNSGNNQIAIGYQAGQNNTLANQFILQHTSANSTPLLQGDLAAGELAINGTSTGGFTLNVYGTANIQGALDAPTLNTGQGDNELYAMDQNVRTTDDVTFNSLVVTAGLTADNATATNATSTNFFASVANFTTAAVSNLTASVANITDLVATNATTTNLVTANLTGTGSINLATSTIDAVTVGGDTINDFTGDGLSVTNNVLGIDDIETLGTSLAAGSVVFSDGANLTEDNANFFWDDANNRLGIGTNNPQYTLVVDDAAGTTRVTGTGVVTDRSYAYYGTASAGQELRIQTNSFKVFNQANTQDNFTVDGTTGDVYLSYNGGNVGIGTTTPSERLVVDGDIQLATSSVATIYQGPSKNIFSQFDANRGAVYLGTYSAPSADTGNYNIAIGGLAGAALATNNGYNVLIGGYAGTALTTGRDNVFLGGTAGYNASTSANSIIIGSAAGYDITTGSQNVVIGTDGADDLVTGEHNVFIGNFTTAASPGISESIVIGDNAESTASHQLVIGSNDTHSAYIDNAYIGSGVTDNAPVDFTLQTTGGEGADVAGANFNLAAGRGTGAAAGGDINFQTAAAGASGSTLNSLIDRMTITAAGRVGIGTTTPGSLLDIYGSNDSKLTLQDTGAGDTVEHVLGSTYYDIRIGSGIDTLRVQNEAGSNSFFAVDSSNGFVGIGTDNPNYELEITDTTNAYALIRSGTSNTAGLLLGDTDSSTVGRVEYDHSDNRLSLWAAGNEILSVTGSKVGIGETNPAVSLAINATDALLLPVGTTAQRPTGATGYIRYNTTTAQFEGYSAGAWQGLGGVVDIDQDTYITAEESADEDYLRFYTAGSERLYITDSGNIVGNATGTDSADFIFGSTQTGDTGNSNQDSRFFFDVSKSAFRAGRAQSDAWDDAKIGEDSAAFGANVTASGTRSVAFNYGTVASGGYSSAFGLNSEALGLYSSAFGFNTQATGNGAVAFGYNTTASGAYSVAFNRDIEAAGNFSFAVALDDNQSGVSVPDNTAAFMGGSVGIGTTTPNNTLQVAGLINFNDSTYSTILGSSAGANLNSTGNLYNTAVGYEALSAATSSANNNAFGYRALYNNTTGSENNAFGNSALWSNTTGQDNSAFGHSALQSNTTGIRNTAVGYQALYANDAGYNTAVGYRALRFNTSGTDNSALGYGSLDSNTTGIRNTALGRSALYGNTTGNYNVGIGYRAGRYLTDGSTANATSSNSIYIGAFTEAQASGNTNEIVIGHGAEGVSSNSVVLGNSSIATTVLRGNVGIGTTSPAYPLDVAGRIRGESFLMAPGTAASPGATTRYIGNGFDADDLWYNALAGGRHRFAFGDVVGATISSGGDMLLNGDLSVNGTGDSYFTGNVGIGTTSPDSKLTINDAGSVSSDSSGLYLSKVGNRTANGIDFIGLDVFTNQTGGSNGYQAGIRSVAEHTNRFGSDLYGVDALARLAPTLTYNSNNTPTTYGVSGRVELDGGDNSWTLDNAYGLHSQATVGSGDTIVDYYGLFLGDAGGTGSITNNYGVYQQDTSADNYFAGNVGIGTTNPAVKLDVRGNAQFLSNNDENRFLFNTGSASSDAFLRMYNNTATQQVEIHSNGDTYFNGGNVGIGTTSPLTNLDVYGTGSGESAIFSNYGAAGIRIWSDRDASSNQESYVSFGDGNVSGVPEASWYAGQDSSRKFQIGYTAGAWGNPGVGDLFTVTPSGNVGIGTTSPGAKLTVEATAGNLLTLINGGDDKFVVGNDGRTTINQTTNTGGALLVNGLYGSTFRMRHSPTSTAPQTFLLKGGAGSYGQRLFDVQDSNSNVNFTVVSNGNVGIGTTSPAEKLHVEGNIRLSNNTLSPDSVTFGAETSTGLQAMNENGYVSITPLNSGWAHFYTDRSKFIFNEAVYTIGGRFASYSSSDLTLSAGGSDDHLTVQNGTGNVGIGTASPARRLNVEDSSIVTALFESTNASGGLVDIEAPTSAGYVGTRLMEGGATRGFFGYYPSTGNLVLSATQGGDELLSVDRANGNVGIGTASPAELLHIESGDTPSIRIEQNASAGWDPYQWDIGGNESNFFVKDVTGSNALPFKIEPGASTDSIVIDSSSNVGIGTAGPANTLDVNGGIDANTLNTGQGDNELYAMNQNVRTSDNVSFNTLGVGLASPGATLEVAGDVMFDGGGVPAHTWFGRADRNYISGETLLRDGNVGISGVGSAFSASALLEIKASGNGSTPRFRVESASAGTYAIEVDGSDQTTVGTGSGHIFLDTSGGTNVGIGTSSPAYTLDVDAGTDNVGIRIKSDDVASLISFNDDTSAPGDIFLGSVGNKLSFGTGGSTKVTIDSSGLLGIGTNSPGQELDVVGSIRQSAVTSCTTVEIDADGDIICGASDENLKKNIENISTTTALAQIRQLQGVTFDWKDTDQFGHVAGLGFIAQDVEKIFPDLVRNSGSYKTLDYSKLTAVLTEAVKAVDSRVEELSVANQMLSEELAERSSTTETQEIDENGIVQRVYDRVAKNLVDEIIDELSGFVNSTSEKITGFFDSLFAEKIVVAREDGAANQSAGEGRISAGERRVDIENDLVDENSRILVTFTSDLGGRSFYIDKEEGGFTVRLSEALEEDAREATFDYLIIGVATVDEVDNVREEVAGEQDTASTETDSDRPQSLAPREEGGETSATTEEENAEEASDEAATSTEETGTDTTASSTDSNSTTADSSNSGDATDTSTEDTTTTTEDTVDSGSDTDSSETTETTSEDTSETDTGSAEESTDTADTEEPTTTDSTTSDGGSSDSSTDTASTTEA